MWQQVIAATSNGSGAVYVPGPFLCFFIGRWLWRFTRITLPDGRRVTRGAQLRDRRAALNTWKFEQKRIAAERKRQG